MKRRTNILHTILISVVIVAGGASIIMLQNDLYVNPVSGDDTNNCLIVSPCKTMSRVDSLVQPGDVIHLNGIYTSEVEFTKSGTESEPITLMGGIYDGGSYNSLEGHAVLTIRGDHWIVKDIEVRNGYRFGVKVWGNDVWLRNVNIHHNIRRFMNASGDGCNITVDGGWESGHRHLEGVTGGGVEDSNIHHNCGEGLSSLFSQNTTFRNNIVTDCFSVCIYVDEGQNIKVEGNTVNCENPNFFRGDTANRGISLGIEDYGTADLVSVDIIGNKIIGCRGVSMYIEQPGKVSATIAFNQFLGPAPAVNFAAGTIQNLEIFNNIGIGFTAPGGTLTGNYTPTPSR